MQILGLERAALYQPVLVFDPTTAAMVLSALKDYYDAVKGAYDEGRLNIADFYKTYGDFMSPIQKDMEWYDKNVTGKVRDTINNLYANGIDPLRSAEGRAAVALLIYSMPTGDIAKLRLSAETAKNYLNSVDDTTNPELEKFLGRDLSSWSTLGDDETLPNGVWSANKASKFQDINLWTHHLFDDMDLSYDPEESKKYPGYKAYTKSADTMRKILDVNIDELLRTDLGKYYLHKIESEIPETYGGNRRQAAINELRERIVSNNLENTRVKLEQDPYALARYQNSLRGGGGGGGRKQTGPSYNWMNGLFQRGLTAAFGYDATTGEENAINNIMSDQIGFGQSQRRGTFSGPWAAYKNQANDYVNKFTIYENPMMFAGILNRKMNNEGGVPLTRADLDNLRTQADVVTSTYGYPYQHIPTNKDNLKKLFQNAPLVKTKETSTENGLEVTKEVYNGIEMVPYQDVYTSYQRYGQNGAVSQQWKVAVIDRYTGKHMGDYWYTIPNTREYNIGIPSITEWNKNSEGRYEIPDDINGNKRGLAKAGINLQVRGANERASWVTTGMWGVTSQPFNRDVTYNQEGVALSPYR